MHNKMWPVLNILGFYVWVLHNSITDEYQEAGDELGAISNWVSKIQNHEEQLGATVDGSYPPSPCYRPPDR